MVNMKKSGGQWTLKARGYYTSRTPADQKMIKHLGAITQNDYGSVKILTKG